jgi:DNA-binding winged helix-turn-helix (wHTH) protein
MDYQGFSTPPESCAQPVYEFDNFRFDVRNRLLLKDGRPVALPPRALDVLAMLVRNGGRLVTKDELLQALWPSAIVEESNVTQYMFLLRKALGEGRRGRRFILTAPGQGYRFVPDAREVAGAGAGRGVRVAVLPFRSTAPGEPDAAFGLGISDVVVTALSGLSGVSVCPACLASAEDPLAGARETGADMVVRGFLQRSADRLRATVQLIGVRDGSLAWAGKFEAKISRLFALEDAIAEQVAGAVTAAMRLTRPGA